LADRIKSEFGVQPELVGGSGGIFDVQVDGKLIYSKHETGRFPKDQEVLEQLRE
jgi:selenoprotein W-related protein